MKLSEAKARLRDAGVPDFSHDAALLFSEIGKIPHSKMIGNDPECDIRKLEEAVERRCKREPLQYILGYTYFFRERYTVNESCLIPRADTELLVETAVERIPDGESFADLCTGSGCVGISVLANTVGTTALLADISKDALELARLNARDNGVENRAEFLLCDVRSELPPGEWFAILSNPPYVSDAAYASLEREIGFEPRIAFVGGEDGADFYRILIPACLSHLKDGGFMAFEIGYDQAEIIMDIADKHGLFCEIKRDLSGNPRVALLTRR